MHFASDSDCEDIYTKGHLTSNTYNIVVPVVDRSLLDIEDFGLPPESQVIYKGDLVEFTPQGFHVEEANAYLWYNNIYVNFVQCDDGCEEGACSRSPPIQPGKSMPWIPLPLLGD